MVDEPPPDEPPDAGSVVPPGGVVPGKAGMSPGTVVVGVADGCCSAGVSACPSSVARLVSVPSGRYALRAASTPAGSPGSASGPLTRGAQAGLPTAAPVYTRFRHVLSVKISTR